MKKTKISELLLDPANARKHGEKNLGSIKASLKRFGQQKPIVVDAGGVVVAGNGTLAAAQSLGWDSIDVVRTKLKGAEATAYAIADNRTAELAEWDESALAETLAALQNDETIDEIVTGFDSKEIDKIIASTTGLDVMEDEVPEPPPEPITQPGDLWQLGRHRVLCGDSTNAEDVGNCLAGKHGDTVCDPPYGIGYEYASHDDSPEKNEELTGEALALSPGAKIWTCGLMNLSRELARFPKAKVAVWHKGFSRSGNGLGGASTWEPVIIEGVKGGSLPNDYLHFGTDRIEGLREKHTCPKPVALFAHLIEKLTGGLVYDPFLGSGTTLIAAEQLDRTCYGIEIEPRYVDVIVQRWENLTGEKAERVSP